MITIDYLRTFFGKDDLVLNTRYPFGDIEYDFTDSFNWNPGDFNDNGSCFLKGGSNTIAATIMKNNGLLAFRLYKRDKGYARGWLYLTKEDELVIFNVKCPRSMEYEFLGFLEKCFGISSVRITINNSSDYVYADSRTGFLLGRNLPEKPKGINLDVEINLGKCYNCQENITKNPIHNKDETYCGECFSKLFFYCFGCSILSDMKSAKHLNGNTQLVCKDCRVDKCPGCGVEITINMVNSNVRRKYLPYNKKHRGIPKRLWYCNSFGCNPKAVEELKKPIPKKMVEAKNDED